jgi:hypothetical protein
VENERFRKYLLGEKRYVGFAGPRLSRKAFSEISKISVPCLKFHDTHPDARLKPITQRRLAAAQILMRANQQQEILDDKATKAAALAAARAEAAKAKALDKLLSRKYRPLSNRAKQASIFA